MPKLVFILLLRVVLVVAAYAVEFAVFSRYPMPDRLFAIIPGTLLGLLLLMIRKDQIGGVLFVAIVTLIGMAIGFILFAPTVDGHDGVGREIMTAVAGAVIGGIVALISQDRLRGRKASRSSH